MSPQHSGRHKTKSTRRNSRDQLFKIYTEVLLYIILPWFFIFLARRLETGVYIAFSGALAIVSITIVKLTKYKPLVFVSVFSILILLMSLIWRWTIYYLIPVITADIATNVKLFTTGLLENLICVALVLIYQRQLTHLRMKINYDWYASKSYRKFIRLLVYFLFFIILFWISGFIFHRYLNGFGFDKTNLTISAAVSSFLIPGTLAVLYLIKPPAKHTGKHTHKHKHKRRHHRHPESNSQPELTS